MKLNFADKTLQPTIDKGDILVMTCSERYLVTKAFGKFYAVSLNDSVGTVYGIREDYYSGEELAQGIHNQYGETLSYIIKADDVTISNV